MIYHRMEVTTNAANGTVTFSCPICERLVEMRAAGGGVKVLNAGDQRARHSGWAEIPGVDTEATAEVVPDTPPTLQ